MKKLVIGCAIVGGVVMLAGIVGTIAFVQFARNNLPDTDAIEADYQQLLDDYGTPEEYTPPLELVPERVAAFAAVRDSLAQVRVALVGRIQGISQRARSTGDGFSLRKVREVITLAKDGIGVARTFLEMGQRGTQLLARAEMGVGEYGWLQGLTTYAWLGWDASTIPIKDTGHSSVESHDVEDAVRELQADFRRVMVQQMVNQIGAYENRSLSGREQELLARAQAELARVQDDRTAFPYRQDFPVEWAVILAPYRDRLRQAMPQTGIGLVMEHRFSLGTAGRDLFQHEGLQVEIN